jgi:hypothetical protein
VRRGLAFTVLLACSSDVDDMPLFDAGVFDSTTQNDSAPFTDAAIVDAAIDATKFNGGGSILCGDCVCDGTLNVCFSGRGAGGMPIASDASFGDASACAPNDGGAGCVAIPVVCLPKPTCECLAPFFQNCVCAVDPTGNAFVIMCPVP